MALIKTDVEVGFVDLKTKTIEQITKSVLESDDYKGKIVLTKNGIVHNGYLVSEPNETPYGFVQGFRNTTTNTEVIAKGDLYTDNTYATAITGDATKLYYVEYQSAYRLYFYVQDYVTNATAGTTGAFVTVNQVYKQLSGDISAIETKTEGYSESINDLKSKVSALESNYSTLNTTVTEQGTKITSVQNQVTELYVNMGAANGIATLDNSGKVPASQLPSYVDDTIEGYYLAYGDGYQFFSKNDSSTQNLITAESGKIYVALNTNLTYRWSGSQYVEISPSIALGETSSTAYPGNKGKATTDSLNAHRADTSNPHNVTKSQVGLSNVDNTADKDKIVSQATKDGAGNDIASTYIKKSSITTSLSSSSTDAQVPSAKAVYDGTVNIVTLTQAQYDALKTKDNRTVYLITDSETVYADLDAVNFVATGLTSSNLTESVLYDWYNKVYTNGTALGKTVYIHFNAYPSSSNSDGDTWKKLRYIGARYYDSLTDYFGNTASGATVYIYSCRRGSEEIVFGLYLKGTSSAGLVMYEEYSKVLYGHDIENSCTSEATDKVASAAAVKKAYDLAKTASTNASAALSKLTWYTEA